MRVALLTTATHPSSQSSHTSIFFLLPFTHLCGLHFNRTILYSTSTFSQYHYYYQASFHQFNPMDEESDDSPHEGCNYNHCEKHLPLDEIRSRDLKDECNQAYKNISRDMKDHYGRYHKNAPVSFEYPINNINRSMEVYRDSGANWDYVCVCRRSYRDRSSVQRHFKDCGYFKQVAPFVASRIPTGTITIPLPFTIAPPIKAKRRRTNLDEIAHLDMHADIIRSTTSQVQQLQQKLAEQDVTIQRMQEQLEHIEKRLIARE
ncbi:hypothetical protein EDD21DRAFT_388886 [Dissophora ornata]|nr:hypothetical protein EDD21DRAFT_388886 [Dissophora ornata]